MGTRLEDDQREDQTRIACGPMCPCCGGILFPCRGAFQCSRCNYRLCDGCQGAENPHESDD